MVRLPGSKKSPEGKKMREKIAVVILAAGKGTRLNCSRSSKVMKKLAGRPMIAYTADLVKKLGFSPKQVYLVVGFGKDEVMNFLGSEYHYVYQPKLLGTADAVKQALKAIPPKYLHILILQADDSAFYPAEEIERLIKDHFYHHNHLTFLTVEKSDPGSLGRVLRDRFGRLTGIVEAKDASKRYLKVKEINAAVYFADCSFLKSFLPQIKPSPVSKEYYLPELIKLGLKNQSLVMAVKVSDNDYYQGINTKEELLKADRLMKKNLKEKNDS